MQIKQCVRECDRNNGFSKYKKDSLFIDGCLSQVAKAADCKCYLQQQNSWEF
jgi:hypothetical protein